MFPIKFTILFDSFISFYSFTTDITSKGSLKSIDLKFFKSTLTYSFILGELLFSSLSLFII